MAAVLDAFASKLADILLGMAKEEVEMLLGVPGEITKLETTLGDLSSILADAERKRMRDSAAERWVRDLKDAMYEADDILDLCKIMEAGEDPSSSTVAPRTTTGCWKISVLSCFRNPVVAHEIGRKIQALNHRLDEIAKRSSRFQFITQAVDSSGHSANRATNSPVDGNRITGPTYIHSDIVGEKVEESKRKLIDLLIEKVDVGSSGNNVVVAAAITGTGGIGKTTLARMIFNDAIAVESFDKMIWLSVNKEVNEISVLQRVIAAFGGDYKDLAGDKALLEHALKQAVWKKKFLLVMDDVWSEKVWNELFRVPLNGGAFGSQVLVTTRNEGVARGMKAQHLHRVDKLDRDDAWILLKKQVVLNASDEPEVNGLKDIGIKILERCDGLPLAIKVLGGLLLNITRTRDAWVDVCNHSTWSIVGLDDDINKTVYLSYEELPSHLKQCFVYCSLIPKDELIRRDDMIQLWIAEDYVNNKIGTKLQEDLGLEYYKELVSRNLLEPDEESYGQTACTMHDAVRSFVQYITQDQGVLVNEVQNTNSTFSTLKVRHLSISNKAVECDGFQKQASLRTLMLFGSTTVELKDLWNNLSCLRVLYLKNVNLVELPDSICNLKHLRYLCLCYTSISTIPQGIGDLIFLQAIDLCGCKNISQLPNSILKLRKLRSLNFIGTAITSIPRGFGKLEALVEMVGFPTHSDDTTDGWCSLEELGTLSKLKNLSISGLEKVPSGSVAARAMLSNKHHLADLDLIFTSRLGDNISKEEHERIEQVLGNLCPPNRIGTLTIKGYFGSGLPQWARSMLDFGSLTRLVLEDYACCTQLPNGLGQLPFLDYVWIEHAPSVQCVGHDFLLPCSGGEGDGNGEAPVITGKRIDRRHPHHISRGAGVAFPKLKILGFQGMWRWSDWDWEEQVPAMPILEALTIDNCKLRHLPAGLAQHAGLKRLYLENVLHLVSVENFSSLNVLKLLNNPRLERISNCPSLDNITILQCPAVNVLEDLPSLRSIEWRDWGAEALPLYLRGAKLNKLAIRCTLSLLKLISLQDDSSEWGKIRHVQQLKVYAGWKPATNDYEWYILYTKEPYFFETNISTTSTSIGERAA